jgi:hypothetical protein
MGCCLSAGTLRVPSSVPRGTPVLYVGELDARTDPDSVRVRAAGAKEALPVKVEWTAPTARISWISTGARAYDVDYEPLAGKAAKRQPEPAMIGAGDRISLGGDGGRGRLSVGLWAHPAAVDVNGDGALDLIVGCPDHPYNGTYLFLNLGTNAQPLYSRGRWLGRGYKDLVAADFNGDGRVDLVVSGGYFNDAAGKLLSEFVPVKVARSYHVGRDDLWYPVDWDGDGRIDLLIGASDWREYGWDDAFNAKGEWTRGPIHGYVWFHRNIGTNEKPEYAEPVAVEAGGKRIDLRGSPSPAAVDWFGRGRLDLIGGDFVDTVTVFENTGGHTLAAGKLMEVEGRTLHMDLCMIQPRVVQWHADGRPSLLVGEEDGRVALLENLAPRGQAPRLAAPRYLEQVEPYVKCGALARPVATDWNQDGKLDIVCGNAAGRVQYFENTGTRERPAFADRGNLRAAGQEIRILAGPNGSIQGPVEEKWGYTNPTVADWDLDGKPDLLLNSIWGEVLWYRNVGEKGRPVLAEAQRVEVEWPGAAPKPEWNWWNPKGKQLVAQWRTTPEVVDWDRDGMPDLVMLDHEGYLALYRRFREDGKLKLAAPQRIFMDAGGQPLRLAPKRTGSSGRRKIELVDWDGDGDLDLLTDGDTAVWYENTGTQSRPAFALRGDVAPRKLAGHNPCPNAADWNGDGKLDLIVGAEDGHLYYFDRRFLAGGK